jgi:hypothetical protein
MNAVSLKDTGLIRSLFVFIWINIDAMRFALNEEINTFEDRKSRSYLFFIN